MKIYIVMEDLGDGDVGLNYFQTWEAASDYQDKNLDWCYYESNPRVLDTDNIKFTSNEEDEL